MPSPLLYQGATELRHLGVIRARGADAASFLQSQLTNDVSTLAPTQARLAGFCSAKGRLQASFWMLRPAADEVLLIAAADLLAATLKRLSMFVLRAKCKLDDASAELPLLGVVGAAVAPAPAASWQVAETALGRTLRLPDADGLPRCVVIGPAGAAAAGLPPLPLDTWRWLDLHAGIALIETATVDKFVPQMLNYEIVGGVDFKKGCYPGQEIVARSQYRGTIKRRMFLFDCAAVAQPGAELFDPRDAAQPAGLVANAAPHPDGSGSSVLAEVKLAAVDAAPGAAALRLNSADGPTLTLRDLPYPVPRDTVEVP
ncbi:MAG TPA: folate-binding protein [Burkholderiaceae bacterium]|nr:folate-binding protein [Burkholderiaceae bacterium]